MSEVEVSDQGSVESSGSESPAPEAPKTPVPVAPTSKLDNLKSAAAKGSDVSPSLAPTTPAAQVPAYVPNYKIKVDKEEKEMDEFFRSLAKDKESEEKLRKTLQRAEIQEIQAQRHEKLKQEHQDVSTRYNAVDKSLTQLSKYLNEGDMESFCYNLKINDKMILEYAQKIIAKIGMDPNQRAEADRIRQDRLRANQLETQNQELQSSFEQQKAETGLMQTEMLLSKPEYAQVAQAFDNHIKRQGAFVEEVCKQGILAEKTRGVVLSPEEAVQAALQIWSPFLSGQTQAPPQAQVVQQQPPVVLKTPPPTIPNIGSRGSSPLKQGVRSIADLKKLQKTI